jgi:hypothetical protein
MKTLDQESRETLVIDLTNQLLRDWTRKLMAGDARALSDLHNTVLDRLSEEDCKRVFVTAAVHQSGNELNALAARAMYDRCRADAEQSAAFIELTRKQAVPEHRIPELMRI